MKYKIIVILILTLLIVCLVQSNEVEEERKEDREKEIIKDLEEQPVFYSFNLNSAGNFTFCQYTNKTNNKIQIKFFKILYKK